MEKELKRRVIESDEVQEAIYDYITAPEDRKNEQQMNVGKVANEMACKLLKAKGWSNKAIAEYLDISELRVEEALITK